MTREITDQTIVRLPPGAADRPGRCACSRRRCSPSTGAVFKVELLWWIGRRRRRLLGPAPDALRQLDLRGRRVGPGRRATSACRYRGSRSRCSWRPPRRPRCTPASWSRTVGSANVTDGTGKEFEAIITAVVGGTLLTGGYGSVLGSAFGAFILGATSAGHPVRGHQHRLVPSGPGRCCCSPPSSSTPTSCAAPRGPADGPQPPVDRPRQRAVHPAGRDRGQDRRVRTAGRQAARSDAVPVLEARDVSKYFGRVIALEKVSLSVRPGEVNCLLGDNGAGKSTLIKILSGVHSPTAGSCSIDGQPVQFSSPRDALDRGHRHGLPGPRGPAAHEHQPQLLRRLGADHAAGARSAGSTSAAAGQDRDASRWLEIGIQIRDPGQLVGHAVGRRAPDARHRPRRVLRGPRADPRRADLGARASRRRPSCCATSSGPARRAWR